MGVGEPVSHRLLEKTQIITWCASITRFLRIDCYEASRERAYTYGTYVYTETNASLSLPGT
jgi:hypothetical protein